jgi:hypothetical protein
LYSFWNSSRVEFQSASFTRPERKKTLKVAMRGTSIKKSYGTLFSRATARCARAMGFVMAFHPWT